jgi:hypothetical protein
MNAEETIQKAIDKLHQLRDETTPGPWLRRYVIGDPNWPVIISDDIGEVVNTTIETFTTKMDADLIVTLHATIDAQIAILDAAREQYAGSERTASHDEPAASWMAVHLARAILGEQVNA